MQVTEVPTGHICILDGEHGPLEFLSLGDYGKEANLKADFLGLTDKIDQVQHQPMLPLEKKWVITISPQYGCSMDCEFCDVPLVGPGKNATYNDMITQVLMALSLNPNVKMAERINLHYARMGEPTFNWDVINSATWLAGFFASKGWGFHPVISTMMPSIHMALKEYITAWMHLKNNILRGNAGLQISVNTTDETLREKMFGANAMNLRQVSYYLNHLNVVGRKITLNFALTDAPIDANKLAKLFNPEKFLCKITPMHLTTTAIEHGHRTGDEKSGYGYLKYYPYELAEEALKKAGFDVIIFVPSKEEDESRITCGNAILSDKK